MMIVSVFHQLKLNQELPRIREIALNISKLLRFQHYEIAINVAINTECNK